MVISKDNEQSLVSCLWGGHRTGAVAGNRLVSSRSELPLPWRGHRAARPGSDFTLTDQNGNLFRLSDQKGKILLIFFGYTHCPDVCPITLAEFKQIKAMLGDKADQVRFVFVTVDPERDTPETINTFLQNFDPTFIGLTSDRATLEPVWKAYGVYQEQQDAGSAAGYLVDHSTPTYLIDPQGLWHINYPYGMEAEKIAQDLQHMMKEQ